MARLRNQTWFALAIVGIGLLAAAIPGLWLYMGMSAKRLHPDARSIPGTASLASSPKWSGSVEQSRRIVRAFLSDRNLPGLSVAVGVGADLVWAEGFGFADLEKHTPVTPSHRFRIGTASVALTSAAAGLLLEKGMLKLEEPIQSHVPEYTEKPWPVSLRQVMGHIAGIRSDGGDEGPLLARSCKKPVEALSEFGTASLLFEPGTRYRFSNYGWILVSAAIESAADEPFLSFMQERILDPVGMRHTVADTGAAPDRAASYFPRFAADPKYGLHPMRELDYSCYAGSSVFLSTPSDLVRFGMAINHGDLLRRDTVQLLQSSQRLRGGEETGYGLGWDIETVTLAGKPTRVVGHDGDVLGGMVSSLVVLPDRGLVVAAVSNISYAGAFALATRIAETFLQ